MKKIEVEKSMKLNELKTLSQEYAIKVSPYPQDKGATYDTATAKAYIDGFRDACRRYGIGIRKG